MGTHRANPGQQQVMPTPPPAGSGSVKATDGSTITWTTAANGTVTAVGTGGAKMVIAKYQPLQSAAGGIVTAGVQTTSGQPAGHPLSAAGTHKSAGVTTGTSTGPSSPVTGASGTQTQWSVAGQKPYLIVRSLTNSATNLASVQIIAAAASLLIEMTVKGTATTVPAKISGKHGATSVKWSGQFDLTANPKTALAVLPGWPSTAFEQQLREAAYFKPASEVLAAQQPGVQAKDSEAAAYERAVVWGIFGAVGAAATGPGVLVIVIVGLAGFDASIWADTITLMNENSVDPDPPPNLDFPDDEQPDDGCFAEGTLVSLGNGGLQVIERIALDDLIASRDESSGQNCAGRVTHTWAHRGKNTIDLTLENGERVRTTAVHRIFAVDKGIVPAAELRVGDRVETLTGVPLAIVNITPGPNNMTVHNLTVEGLHTYFVGEAGVWVHNAKQTSQDDPPPPIDDGGDDGGDGSDTGTSGSGKGDGGGAGGGTSGPPA